MKIEFEVDMQDFFEEYSEESPERFQVKEYINPVTGR